MITNPNSSVISTIQAKAAAALLDQHPDFRVLRRIGDAAALAVPSAGDGGATRVAVIVDCETTGLDPTKDRIIEIAMRRCRFDASGAIVEIGTVRTWLEDPGFSVPPEISRITGLHDEDLAGQAIDTDAATEMLFSADVVIAHFAGFDRPFAEARFPGAAGLAWACSLSEVPWADLSFEGRSLGYLLAQMGWFYRPHRAQSDVTALMHLLSHRCNDGERVLAKLVNKAERPTVRIDARLPDYSLRFAFKGRGYNWDAPGKSWWLEVDEQAVESEQLWIQRLGHLRPAHSTPVSWRERHK